MNMHLSVEIILNSSEVLCSGDSNPCLYVAQSLLLVLSQVYGSIGAPTMSGILDDSTADSLSSFQALIGLPMTGNLDKVTWKHLALHFPLAANLAQRQAQHDGRSG